MRNRFLCLCLALVMVLPFVLGSCSQVVVPPEVPAPVYTLYCITGDTTTDEAITKIEYELNRILFYRIGSIVKLEFATADEYHDLIEAKMLEIEEYTTGTNEKGDKNTLLNTAKLSETAKAAGFSVCGVYDQTEDHNKEELEKLCDIYTDRLDRITLADFKQITIERK